jgi:fructose-specific phosphotransferase system IIC component
MVPSSSEAIPRGPVNVAVLAIVVTALLTPRLVTLRMKSFPKSTTNAMVCAAFTATLYGVLKDAASPLASLDPLEPVPASVLVWAATSDSDRLRNSGSFRTLP